LFLNSDSEFREPEHPDPAHVPGPYGVSSGDAPARKHQQVSAVDGKKVCGFFSRYKWFRRHGCFSRMSIVKWILFFICSVASVFFNFVSVSGHAYKGRKFGGRTEFSAKTPVRH
jgi:hypothetical protein